MLSLLLYNKVMDFSKYLTKEGVIIVAVVIYTLVQSKYFATTLQLEQLRNDVLQQKIDLQNYSDTKDEEILSKLEQKYELILTKLDKLKH